MAEDARVRSERRLSPGADGPGARETRLLARSEQRRAADAPVAGVPVDSEYIVFVIDTSGSMQRYAWPAMNRKMAHVLDAYPKVKGMQVMNDQGEFMFKSYAGKWIPDTPARRQAVLEHVRFATLMRLLCDRNGGAFVGLSSLSP